MNIKGLTDKEVKESRAKYGSNEIPDSEPTTFWQEFNVSGSDDPGAACDRGSDDRNVFLWVCRDL